MSKSVEAKLGSVDVKVSFFTSPSGEARAAAVPIGEYRGNGQLELSAELKAGSVTFPPGTYTAGAIRDGEDQWTMVLYPGRTERRPPDISKLIKLDSWFTNSATKAQHTHWDITPGHGDMAGRFVLVWHYGSLYLAGALS